MITQLSPPLPLETSKGAGLAHFVIDYGPETDLMWVVFLDKDGSCWSVPNPEIRIASNWSMGRRPESEKPAATPAEAAVAAGGPRVHVFPRASES